MSKLLCNSEVQSQLLKLLKKTSMSVSIEYVARHLNMGWGTARAMLLELVGNGKVAGQKTMKSWIFWMRGSESKGVREDEGGS